MKVKTWIAGALAGAALLAACPRWPRRSSPSGGSRASTRPKTTRCSRDQEVRGQAQGRQDRTVAVPGAGHDPQDRLRARLGQPARRGLCRRLRLPGHRQVGLRRQARRHQQRDRPDPRRASRPTRSRPPSSTTTRRKTRAYYAFPIKQQTMHIEYWIDMLADAGFKESTSRPPGRTTGPSGATRCSRLPRRRPAQRAFGIGLPMGVDSSDSFYSFLTFTDAYNVKLVSDSGKLLVDDPAVRQGLINALTDYTALYTKGCTPPSSHELEGPGQQRRLPQQDDGDDAQRDDLDRRQVARRHEQRHAHATSSARRRRRTTPS